MAAGLDKSTGLKVRIARLESVVERLSKISPDQLAKSISDTHFESQLQSPTSVTNTKISTDNLEHQANTKLPLFALFSNEIIRASDDLSLPSSLSCRIDFGCNQLSDEEKLLGTISKETEILDVLSIASSWWMAWQNFYPGLRETGIAKSLQDFVSFNLAQGKPVLIATGLLCIAMSLQNIRPGIDDQNLNLSTSVTELMNRISAAIDQVVLDNDNYISNFDGVLLLVMRGKHYAECNQLRKAWLSIRRSILLAQKVGLARPRPQTAPASTIQCQQFIDSMFETDRFFSMFLGMPYALDTRFNDAHSCEILLNNCNVDGRMRVLRRITAVAAGSINDRNSGPEDSAFNITVKIQNLLQTAVESLPLDWWNISTHTTHINNPLISYEHLHTQLWFYQVQCFLHLPYMLRAASDLSFENSREVCLNASRKLVKIWIALRQNAILSVYTCRLDDFQGLMSIVIVLVGLLQYLSRGKVPECSSVKEDFDLITTAKEVFRHAAQQQCGSIAKQSLRVIETLSSFIQSEDIANHTESEPSPNHRNATLFVPYFGAIMIESGPFHFPQQTHLNSQNQQRRLSSSPHGSARRSTTGSAPNGCLKTLLSEFNLISQESIGETTSRDKYPSMYQLSEREDEDVDLFPTLPEILSTSSEMPFPSYQQIDLTAEDVGYDSSGLNTLPTGFNLDWDKIMMEIDLNQNWDAAFTEFAGL